MAPIAGRAHAQPAGQPLQSFRSLALRVNLDDQLRVVDRSGARITGRLTRLTPDDIAIQTDAGEKHFTSDAVREVAVRGYALRKGALIGAGVFAVLGTVINCSRNKGGSCVAVGLFGASPIGAGAGLAVGALIPHMKTVYRAPENAAAVSEPRGPSGFEGSLLEGLGLRVNLDDQLRVEDQSGASTTGRLTQIVADEVTIRTATGEKRFTRENVRQIALRRQPLRRGVLIGAGVGVVAGAVAACTGGDREECADAPILAGAVGAGVGLGVAALMHTTTVVYPAREKRMSLFPVVSRGALGVRASWRW